MSRKVQFMRYPILATHLYGVPLLLQPEKAAVIESVFRTWALAGDPGHLPDGEHGRQCGAVSAPRFADKPYVVTDAGVAVIPVMGAMVHRGSQLDAMSGLQSYSTLERKIDAAATDKDVRGILFEMDSPGGQAAGVFDLAAKVQSIAKPTLAHVNEMALSAGYILAAATQKIVMARTAMVGSIGVIALHVDRSKKNAKDGYAYTAIHAGAKKADGSPHSPLSDSARSDMQSRVDELYTQFVDYVAQARGIDPAALRAQEAGVFSGQAAVDAGLADGISSFNDALAAFEADVSQGAGFSTGGFRQLQTGGKTMSANTQSAAQETVSADQLAAQLATARTEGAQAMQARIQAIQTCDEAKGREKLAAHLAFSTAMSADEAKGLLSVSAVESAPVAAAAAQNPLAAGMAKVTNPAVGSEEQAADSNTQAEAAALWGRSNAKLRAVK